MSQGVSDPAPAGRKFIRALGENLFEPFGGWLTQASGSNKFSLRLE